MIRNYLLPISAFMIVCLSLFTLYSAIYVKGPLKENSVFVRQLLWIGFGTVAYLFFSRLNYRKLISAAYPLYIAVIFLLILVLFIGGVRLGAQRWIKVWWFNFQPSEFAKLAIIFVLSSYFSRKGLSDIKLNVGNLSFMKGMLIPFSIIAIPFGLIVKQPDLGTALLLLFIFLGMAYLAGVKLRYIATVLLIGAALSPFFWHFLKDYQKDRLIVFLNPNSDPLGAGYTIIQSKIAIGSGRFFGKGWLSGTQGQLNFLPEAHTDFIFGIFAEETGFLGCLFLFGLYYALIRRAFLVSENADDNFGKFISFGLGFMLAFQVYINISMSMGLSPVVGVPLPLMSYGGSSMLVTLTGLGILRNIEKRG
jgi:rod shape determining protein RodA